MPALFMHPWQRKGTEKQSIKTLVSLSGLVMAHNLWFFVYYKSRQYHSDIWLEYISTCSMSLTSIVNICPGNIDVAHTVIHMLHITIPYRTHIFHFRIVFSDHRKHIIMSRLSSYGWIPPDPRVVNGLSSSAMTTFLYMHLYLCSIYLKLIFSQLAIWPILHNRIVIFCT